MYMYLCFVVRYVMSIQVSFAIILVESFAFFVFLVSRDCCVALPRGGMGLSAVCDCGYSLSYLLTFLNPYKPNVLFSGHWLTVQTQIKRRRTLRLI